MFNLKVYTMKRQRFFEGLGLKVYVTLAICMALLLNVQFLNAQSSTINVKGVVNDAMGPVIGASVVEKGNATNGTITDIDGNFSLKVPSDATLTISFIGYKTVELPVAGKTSFTVTLKEDSEMLDEVVVIGFGTQKKVNLTGSVGLATAKEIEARPVANATQALQGLVPGLQITTNTGELDKNMSINIRGNGTIGDGSSGSPLILIDGMEGDINTVNPQDIENISVLKDAAASSIYGSRAPFGVILVTTKKGKSGKPTINYNNSFRFNSPVNLGPVSFQPSELAKLAIIIFLAVLIERHTREVSKTAGVIKVFVYLAPLLLIVAIGNLSTAIIIFGIAFCILFVANPQYKPFFALAGVGIVGVVGLIAIEGYRGNRVDAWLHPETAGDKGYQTMQGLYAIGSGKLFGKGLGESLQKMGNVPESQNDMIFTIICEELGLFGAVCVILLFVLLLWRMMVIANNATDLYGALVVSGIMSHIAIQVILNIAVVTNTIPNTGVILPFISYGGTSIVFLMGEMGLEIGRASCRERV